MSVLVAGTIVAGGASAATAAPRTFNPFDINNGFTTVAQGDIALSNGEIEGSVAAFGSISTENQNGYPVIHAAAGEADYTVPTIDGTPVRILAQAFTGSGAFDLSNRDDSGTIATDSPEASAVIKLVDTNDLLGSQRGDFLRLTNAGSGVIDLKAVPFANSDVADYKTAESSVSSYFTDIDARVMQTNQCLASMYDTTLGLTNIVDTNEQDGMLFPTGFATDRPNVIDYADVAGKTVKMDDAAGYTPTEDAPLVIRVAPGTTSIGAINVEGWSAQKGAQQSLARYILLDMSDVTGEVTIDGLALGAIWAPSASLKFDSGITTNGQWFAGGDITTAGGGEIHHHTFLGSLPCADQPTTPGVDPSIRTTVAVEGSPDKVLPLTGGTVIDTVTYAGLTPGATYQLAGEIRTAPAGDKTGLTATTEFIAESAAGTTAVPFEIAGAQVTEYAGQDLVVYEYLTLNGDPVAEHADPEDDAQTFRVAPRSDEPIEPSTPADPGSPADPDDTSTTNPSGNGLAQTGAEVSWALLTGGAILLAIGLSLVLARRRLRS